MLGRGCGAQRMAGNVFCHGIRGSGRYKGRRTLQKNKPRLHTGKLFARVVTERIIQKIEFQVNDEQVGFRRGRKCVHRVFRL